MSVADRLTRMELRRTLNGHQEQTEDTPSTILVRRDPPVAIRLRGLVSQLADFQLGQTNEKFGRMGLMLQVISEELFEEIRDFDEMTFSRYLLVVAKITEWVATGNLDLVPEELRPMLIKIENPSVAITVEETSDA